MIGIVLLFAIWPFHHKSTCKGCGDGDRVPFGTVSGECKPTDDASSECFTSLHPPCDKVDGLYFYMGDDKMIGFSPASCEAAIHNWTLTHIDPVKMSRS